MTKERFEFLMALDATDETHPLTREELDSGYHFCWDWDGLLVGPEEDSEWGPNVKQCYCGLENPKGTWL